MPRTLLSLQAARGVAAPLVVLSGFIIAWLRGADLGQPAALPRYAARRVVRPHLDSGALEPVLLDWWQRFPGPFLYYPGRRLVPAPLRAFIDFVASAGHAGAAGHSIYASAQGPRI